MGTRVRVRGPTWNPTMDVASFPNRFCISLDYPRLVGLATTGHIRSLKIFSVRGGGTGGARGAMAPPKIRVGGPRYVLAPPKF